MWTVMLFCDGQSKCLASVNATSRLEGNGWIAEKDEWIALTSLIQVVQVVVQHAQKVSR